jgi:hypothetical protein
VPHNLRGIEPHGGVSDNAFNARASKEATETKPPEEYQPFVEHMREATAKQTAAITITITSDDVAKVIFGAATLEDSATGRVLGVSPALHVLRRWVQRDRARRAAKETSVR